MSITKNRQNFENIQRMVKNVFSQKKLAEVKELSGGYCNVTYCLIFEDDSTAILKVAAKNTDGNLTNEKEMMQVETSAMNLLESNTGICTAKVLAYDTSKTLCSGDYFIMDTIEGQNFADISEQMTIKERDVIYQEIGQTIKYLGKIRNTKFGILSREEYDSMYAFFFALLENLLNDNELVKDKTRLCFSQEELLKKLEKDKYYFDEVNTPSLIHWDIWDGNVFVKDGHISGIIDWERTMWAEPIMSDQFRRHSCKEAMLKGFGKTEFTESEKRRMAWYDLFLFTTMIVEGIYRQYEDDSLAEGVRPHLEAAWADIK